jgi:hypothetical protein
MASWARLEMLPEKLGNNQRHQASGPSPLVIADSVMLPNAHLVAVTGKHLYRMSQFQAVMATCQLRLLLNRHNSVRA